ITNSNGSNGSFSGSTLTLSNSQDISVGSTPSFNNVKITSFFTEGIVCGAPSPNLGLLKEVSYYNTNSNGTNNSLSFSSGTLNLTSSMNQNLDTTGTPSFETMTLTNSGNHLVFQYNGTGNTYTLQKGSTALSASRVISFPATGPGLDCELVLSEATSGSTINGTRTFGSA